MKKYKVLILIPARYESSRFVGKPLALIHGKPMIEWVFKNCEKLNNLDQTEFQFESYVVTDDERIEAAVKSFGGQSLMVKDEVVSGTERIFLALDRNFKQEFDLVINVQGDEPLIEASLIMNLAKFHIESNFDMATVVSQKSETESDDFFNPNMVKVIFNKELGACDYFSRAPIPFVRDGVDLLVPTLWYHHIGVYSYKPKCLKEFCNAPVSYYENTEKLEQLRAFQLGHTIGAIETNIKLIGVDVKEDIKKLEEVLSEG